MDRLNTEDAAKLVDMTIKSFRANVDEVVATKGISRDEAIIYMLGFITEACYPPQPPPQARDSRPPSEQVQMITDRDREQSRFMIRFCKDLLSKSVGDSGVPHDGIEVAISTFSVELDISQDAARKVFEIISKLEK